MKGVTRLNNKIRIYDLAKKLNKSNKELIAVLLQLDIPVKSHSSSIDEETAQIVENILNEADESASQEKKQHKPEGAKSRPEKENTVPSASCPRKPLSPNCILLLPFFIPSMTS